MSAMTSHPTAVKHMPSPPATPADLPALVPAPIADLVEPAAAEQRVESAGGVRCAPGCSPVRSSGRVRQVPAWMTEGPFVAEPLKRERIFKPRPKVKKEHSNDAPPTPSASEGTPPPPMPSFINSDDLSCSDDSSEDEDCYGQPKPPKEPTFDSLGRPKIRPSYYYDQDYDPAQRGERVKRPARRGGFKGVPVFEPTMSEFEAEGGFYGFVKRIEKYGLRAGIVKVIPPKEWSEQLPPVDEQLRPIRLREPIAQHVTGSSGLYRVTNVAKSRIWNAGQWKETAESAKWAAPDFIAEQKKGDRTDRAATAPKRRRTETENVQAEGVKGDVKGKLPEASSAVKRRPGRPAKVQPTPTPAPQSDTRNAPPSASTDGNPLQTAVDNLLAVDSDASKPKLKRASPLQRAEPTEEEWTAFASKYAELPYGMKKADYTVELMREIERRYWRTLTFGEPAMYGADMKGSLFTENTRAWNVAHLGDLLPRLAPASCKIPGVVSPYLYFGMWRATFAWHVEDADLYSINFIHFGAPKFWYSVPQEQADRFERVMEGYFPTDRKDCTQFLRHKSFLASPRVLANAGIHLNRVAQMAGEFILTYPNGYHSGFNLGYNCAESINFATEKWIPIGREARACNCIGDSVNIDVDEWISMKVEEEDKERALAAGLPWPPKQSLPTPPPHGDSPPPQLAPAVKEKKVRKKKDQDPPPASPSTAAPTATDSATPAAKEKKARPKKAATADSTAAVPAAVDGAPAVTKPRKKKTAEPGSVQPLAVDEQSKNQEQPDKPKRKRAPKVTVKVESNLDTADVKLTEAETEAAAAVKPKAPRKRKPAAEPAADGEPAGGPKPAKAPRTKKAQAGPDAAVAATAAAPAAPTADAPAAVVKAPRKRKLAPKPTAQEQPAQPSTSPQTVPASLAHLLIQPEDNTTAITATFA